MEYIKNRTIGLNVQNSKPFIRVWAPKAKSLSVEVSNGKIYPLESADLGYWQGYPEMYPGDRYWIKFNDKDNYPDPASLSQPDGVHKASEFIDLNRIREIHHSSWKGILPENLIIYELHIGTFTPEGTFASAIEKLGYLSDLGVTAIEVMPVSSFPGNRNWGYDGTHPFSVQESYGGPVGFAQFIKACHEHEIAVILDVVYNHLGPEGNYLNVFGHYFTEKYRTPWGNAINFDDSWCDPVRNYFLENALMWLRDFHVDGLRLDAIHAIKDFSPKHILAELSENVHKLNVLVDFNHYLIGETDLNDTRFIGTLQSGGYGLDMQWCDEWHHALHSLLTGEKNGYYSDFGNMQHLVKSFNHAYVYDGVFSSHRKKMFGTSTLNIPGDKFVVFAQNHDQIGNRMMGERLSALVDFESLKLAAGALFLSPFIPLLFMGEEYAEESPFLYFISHGDDHLVELVREGRKEEFRDFVKDHDPPDPASVDTFKKSELKWDSLQDERKQTMLHYYKTLINLRRQNPILLPGDRADIISYATHDHKVLHVIRKRVQENMYALMNFSDQTISIDLSEISGTNHEILLYSATRQWGGHIENDDNPVSVNHDKVEVALAGKSVLLLRTSSNE